MKYKETAKRIRLALDRKNMKAADLARMSNVTKGSVSQYMNGTHAPSNTNAVKMAHVLEVSPVWLMGFDVPMVDESTAEYNKIVKSLNAVDVVRDALERTGYFEETFTDDEINSIIQYAKFKLMERGGK